MNTADNDINTQTIPRPMGGETYLELVTPQGKSVVLTYNDLWMLIVCRASLDGDWQRAKEAAGMVTDAGRKQAIIERLWKLEQLLDGLPVIQTEVYRMNLHRAHLWFNQRPVSEARSW